MLVCPQCEFENPDTNKFCQQCGASLTHQKCPECGASVDWSAKNCHNCGAVTGIIRWAVVAQPAITEDETTQADAVVVEQSASEVKVDEEITEVLVAKPTQPSEQESETESIPSSPESEQTKPLTQIAIANDNDPELEEADIYLDLQQRYQQISPVIEWGENLSEVKLSCFQVLDRRPLHKSFVEVSYRATGQHF